MAQRTRIWGYSEQSLEELEELKAAEQIFAEAGHKYGEAGNKFVPVLLELGTKRYQIHRSSSAYAMAFCKGFRAGKAGKPCPVLYSEEVAA